jgi:hypothetical protein
MYIYRNIEARSRTNCYRGKAITITYSEWVSIALITQHAQRMRRIVLWPVACQALLYDSALCRKVHKFLKKTRLNIKCASWFPLQVSSENFLFLKTVQTDIITYVQRYSREMVVTIIRLSWKLNFLNRIRRKLKYQISWKICLTDRVIPRLTKIIRYGITFVSRNLR